jgi:hypothetical protein
MTEKSRYLGKESGKSSGRWFRNANDPPPRTEAQRHGRGARTGDGRTSNASLLGKIVPVFRRG